MLVSMMVVKRVTSQRQVLQLRYDERMNQMKGLIIPLFEIVDIQKDQIKLYEKQISLLEKQNEFLLTKIKELNIELYKQLTEEKGDVEDNETTNKT